MTRIIIGMFLSVVLTASGFVVGYTVHEKQAEVISNVWKISWLWNGTR